MWRVSELEHRLLQRNEYHEWVNTGVEALGVKDPGHFLETRDGLTWITTDVGLIAIQPRKMNVYTQKQGLLDNYVYALIQR